jgi:large subunit ribosomal protein L17
MRHLKRTAKLGRKSAHRNAMLSNLVCSLIKHKQITTTLAKAKAARSVADKIVTLGKRGTLHARRLAAARLHTHAPKKVQLTKEQRLKWRQDQDVVRILFEEIAPAFKERNGGYTRIIRLGHRQGDAGQRAILEWTDYVTGAPAEAAPEAKPAAEEKTSESKDPKKEE